MRRIAAILNESAFCLAWPFPPRLFARYPTFQRLMLFVFMYNMVVMVASLILSKFLTNLVLASFNLRDLTFFTQTVRWSEGLFYYVVWTAANYPLAQVFRRRFEADMILSDNISSLAPFMLFARPIFWASMAANITYQTFGSGFSVIANPPEIVGWAVGKHEFRDPIGFFLEAYEMLHSVALSVFRAAAITYCLFAGKRAAGAVARVMLAYVVGGGLLFFFYTVGSIQGREAAVKETNKRLRVEQAKLNKMREWSSTPWEAAITASKILGGYRFDKEAEALDFNARMLRTRYLTNWHQEINSATSNQRRDTLRNLYYAYSVHRYLAPYYFICFGGSWFFLNRLKKKRQWLE